MGGERRQIRAGSVSGFRLRLSQISHSGGAHVTSPGPDRLGLGSGATVAPPLEWFSQGVSSAPGAAQLGCRSSAFGPPAHAPPLAPALDRSDPRLGVQTFQSTLRGKCIALFSDNSTFVAYIRKQGGHIRILCRLTWDLFQLCSRLGTELIPCHILGKRNILANALSRADHLVQTEWTRHRDVVHQGEQATSPMLLSSPG
jgi:hypothetical protein